MQERRFVREQGEDAQSWRIAWGGNEVEVALSRLGVAPTPMVFRFANAKEANRYAEDMIRKMTGKGFVEMEIPVVE
jgi:predicted DNA-binding WGR domain protein